MRTARFLLALASLAALLVFAAPAWAETITVPRDYPTIQEAVDAAERGDTVWVAAGVYEETVVIDQAMTLCGAGSDSTIIDGGGKGHVIQVVSDDDIYIYRLAVRNGSMEWPYAGIDLFAAGGCVIEDCVATTTWAGIRFTDSHENTVRRCTFMDVECGVDTGDTNSYGNMIVDCQAASCGTVAYNAYAGSDGLHLLRCSAVFCKTGVQIGWSKGWTVEGCDIVGNGTGIVLDAADDGVVRYNRVTGSVTNGMWVAGPGSSGNHIYGNLFSDSGEAGIVLQGAATGNAIHDNRLQDCGTGVIIMANLVSPNDGNVFSRNAFWHNALHAVDESGYDNPFSDVYPWGNYWDDATGVDEFSGPGQDIPGPDGVFDEAYKLGNVVDQYPATTPDAQAPRTAITSPADGAWVSIPSVDFMWEGADDRTPPEYLSFSYSLDDAPWVFDGASSTFFEDLPEGVHTFSVVARDGMGFDDPTPASITFGVDFTAPLTEDDGDTAWHKADTTVHFNAFDELSGIASTEYSLNGGGSWTPGSEVTIPAPSDGSGDGVWSILYRSVDNAGNVEDVRSCVVKVAALGFAFDHEATPVGAAWDRVNDLAVADLDGDGDQDVVAGCDLGGGPVIVAYQNDGSPFVGDWPANVISGYAESAHSLGAADLDHDGDIDLVQGGGDSSVAQILGWVNDGSPFDGAWGMCQIGVVTSEYTCHAEIALADFDGDGWVDLVSSASAYGGQGVVALWPNDGSPWDWPWASIGRFAAPSLGAVAIADFNADALPDYAVSLFEGTVLVSLNPGGPIGVASWTDQFVGSCGPGMVSDIAPADFDGDGDADLATSIGYLPSTLQVVSVNPSVDGWPQVGYADTAATAVAAGDLDQDLVTDLFTGSHGAGPEVLAHQGFSPGPWGGFAQYTVADIEAAVRAVELADLDGDGDLDAVSGGDLSSGAEVLAWENLHTVDAVDPWSWSDYDWNWSNTSVDIALQGDDIGSGLHHIEYKVGARGAWKVAPAEVFRLGKRGWGSGQYEVFFRAVDNAGNVESPNFVLVSVDGKPPRTTDDTDRLWHSEDVDVHLDARDNVSGVRSTRYSIDGGVWQVGNWLTIAALEDHSNDGVHEIRYYSTDWAGNREVTQVCWVMIDTMAPLVPLARATKEVRPAAAGGPAVRSRSVARLRVDFIAADLASTRVTVAARLRDAKGRVLERVRLAGVEVGRLATLRFAGPAARLATSVRITVRDQSGYTGTRTLRL